MPDIRLSRACELLLIFLALIFLVKAVHKFDIKVVTNLRNGDQWKVTGTVRGT